MLMNEVENSSAGTALDGAMVVWFALTFASLGLLVLDLVRNSPVSWVQKLGWLLVVAYTGPIGLVAFLFACRRPFPGGHGRFTKPTWKQGINSEVHCLAGDATGILIAAILASWLGISGGWEVLLEYGAGFVSGLFVFQALMMLGMFQGRYLLAVRRTVFAETVSMNLVMVGMLPTMVLLAQAWPESREPSQAAFWFRMSLASVAGGVTAFPINHWLVARGLKHGCMTLPGADPAVEASIESTHRSPEAAMSPHDHHAGMDMSPHAGHEAMDMSGAGSPHRDTGHEHHGMTRLPLPVATAWVLATTTLLVIVMVVVSGFAPIPFN